MSMLPPPSVVIYNPPRRAPLRLTIKDLLAYPTRIRAPAYGICASVLPSPANPVPYEPSAKCAKYDPIPLSTLRRIPNLAITRFRDLINSMESVQCSQPMVLPLEASQMLSDGCSPSDLDVQILGAAWLAAQQMLPDERDYDLQMVKHASLEEGSPDHAFRILRDGAYEPLVVIEFKPATVIQGLISILKKVKRGVNIDPTDDWELITRELRMYAAEKNLHDIILMSESTAIYLCFPPDITNPNHLHDYLRASRTLRGNFSAKPNLSVCELVVFALLSAFEKKNIEIRDVSRAADSTADVVPTIRPYREIISQCAAPTGGKRRRDPSARQLAKKLGRRNGAVHDRLENCLGGSTLTFENLPGELPPRGVASLPGLQSLDSGLPSSTPDSSPASLTTAITLTIVRILKPGVAVVTDGKTQFVAKAFPHHSDPTPYKPFAQELAAYAACATLQGTYIPYLYAVGRVAAFDTSILLLEFVGSGTTVANMMTIFKGTDETNRRELANLESRAVTVLQALHQQKVVHRNVAGRNMVLNESGGLVMVNFGSARVIHNDLARFRIGKEADEAAVRAVFHSLYS